MPKITGPGAPVTIDRSRSDPSTQDVVEAGGASPATTTTGNEPAGDPAATMTGAGNQFEDSARAGFVAGQQQGATAATMSPMAARLQHMTSASVGQAADPNAAVLEKLAAGVPSPGALQASPADRLVSLVQRAIAGAEDGVATLETKNLDAVLEPAWASGYEGYGAVADKLSALGFSANADGFTGVSFDLPQADAAAPSPDAFLADVAARLPAAPGADSDPGTQLAQLVKRKLDSALANDETSFDLDTGELDAILGRGGVSYSDVAAQLKKLGYETFADGFMGVSVGWQASDQAGATQAELLDALAAGLPSAAPPSAADSLVALFERKLAEAGASRDSRKKVSLETDELDAILRPVFDNPSAGYQPLADALEKLGYSTSVDGFIGVSASWGD